eukprot:Gb_01852 [translate_table: standard]
MRLGGIRICMILIAVIHISFPVVLTAGACTEGDCSKHGILARNQTVKTKEAGNHSTARAHSAATATSTKAIKSKQTSVDVKNITKSKLGFTSMDVQNKHVRKPTRPNSPNVKTEDYDSYDPAPALVRPPFKLIPN